MSHDIIQPHPKRDSGLTVLFDLGVASRLTATILDEALVDAGINARDFYMLSVLAGLGPLTPTEMAQRSGVPAASVSKILARFAARGFAVERENPLDGRSRIIEIGPQGVEAVRAAQNGFGKVLDDWYDLLGDEVADIQWSLRRLEWALREMSGFEQPDADAIRNRTPGWIRYSGPPLTTAEEDDVIKYIEWILHRRGEQGSAG